MSDHHAIPYTSDARPDTGVSNVTLGFWLFLASEVMLFGALFSSYALLRVAAVDWPSGREVLNLTLGSANTLVLLVATAVMMAGARRGQTTVAAARPLVLAATGLATLFLVFKGLEYRAEWVHGYRPATNTFWAMYFTLTGLHALHVIGGMMANLWLLVGARSTGDAMTRGRLQVVSRYWVFVDVVWIVMFVGLYL